jgi:hypothetical protein
MEYSFVFGFVVGDLLEDLLDVLELLTLGRNQE